MGLFSDAIVNELTAPKLKYKLLRRSASMSNKPTTTTTTTTSTAKTTTTITSNNTNTIINVKKGELNGKASTLLSSAASVNIQQLSTSWEYIRPTVDYKNADTKEEPQDMAPPRFIEVQKGKISLGPPVPLSRQIEITHDKEVLEARIAELEETLTRLYEKVNEKTPHGTSERELLKQFESMYREMKARERKAMQTCRDHKTLQARFQRQENCLQQLSNENKNLHQRVQQYEHCLDDVMRKVVDAIISEDNLREEVHALKMRVRDLEAQNAVLSSSSSASPAKGRDEGYCTMSSGQPQPSTGHLEDLPEEPEQFVMTLAAAEPCSADMEDWSMSQEELGAALEDDNNEYEWFWNRTQFMNSNVDSQSESISQLLQETIIYSDDEEIVCKDFKRDFYKLVNIKSESSRSLRSTLRDENGIDTDIENEGNDADVDADDDDDDDDDDNDNNVGDDDADDDDESEQTDNLTNSPTPSEAGRAQVSSCSSSDDSAVIDKLQQQQIELRQPLNESGNLLQTVLNSNAQQQQHQQQPLQQLQQRKINSTQSMPTPQWRRSTGWKRISSNDPSSSLATSPTKSIKATIPIIISPNIPQNTPIIKKELKFSRLPTLQQLPSSSGAASASSIPPPVPARRSNVS